MLAIGCFAVAALLAGLDARQSANTLADSTGPSLIALQDLSSSVAEANAEATASFLSTVELQADDPGATDRVHHNAYLAALGRAGSQLTTTASLAGSDAGLGDDLEAVAVDLGHYSAAIEGARVAASTGQADAQDRLVDGLGIVDDEITDSITAATTRTQELDLVNANRYTWIARGLGALALVLLVELQSTLAQRTRRIFSVPLVIATLAVIGTIVAFEVAYADRDLSIDEAVGGGYDSITATGDLQSAAFELQSAVGLAVLGDGGAAATADGLMARIDDQVATVQAEADSAREQAATNLLFSRWVSYRETVGTILPRASTNPELASTLYQGDGISSFNGLNTTIDSVLSDNRAQFTDSLDRAPLMVGFLPIIGVVLPVLAALATILGVQQRLEQYR